MNIRINNLGSIPEGVFDLSKKLTVFCGPNNTGKTYVSYVIYALTRIILKSDIVMLDEQQLTLLLTTGKLEATISDKVINELRNRKLEYVKKNLGIIFGLADEKVEKYFDNFDLCFLSTTEDHLAAIKSERIEVIYEPKTGIHLKAVKEKDTMVLRYELTTEESLSLEFAKQVFNLGFVDFIYHCLSLFPISRSTIFPVERISIQTFHQQLSFASRCYVEVRQGSKTISPMEKSARYPLAIKHGLDEADNIVNIQNERGKYASLAREIEETLLSGHLEIDKMGEPVFKSNGAKSKPLPIQMTASVVKSLSSITFFLRYEARENDLIIIDEPELNLHPDSQILLSRMFGKMINQGLRLLISTHSDYIIRELNNLIMLSSTNDDDMDYLRKEFGYDKSYAIKKEEVNAFMFSKNKNFKTSVSKIPIEKDGFEVSTIDATLDNLNQSSQYLYNTL